MLPFRARLRGFDILDRVRTAAEAIGPVLDQLGVLLGAMTWPRAIRPILGSLPMVQLADVESCKGPLEWSQIRSGVRLGGHDAERLNRRSQGPDDRIKGCGMKVGMGIEVKGIADRIVD